MSSVFARFEEAVRQSQLVALATVLDGPKIGARLAIWPDGAVAGTLGSTELDAALLARRGAFFDTLRSERIVVETSTGAVQVFVDIQPPQPRLFVVGAVHTAVALVTFARTLGFRTCVLDSRTAFATRERFAHADTLITRWPADVLTESKLDASSYVVTLTHDDKIDTPALAVALRGPTRYIGALGSRKTHATRVAALREQGFRDAHIARIHAPVGLSIGARRPEEIAVAIIAEIVAVMNGVDANSAET